MVRQFLDYMLYERGCSPLTIEHYEGSLRRFQEWLATLPEAPALLEADSDVVRRWEESLATDKGHKPGTVRTELKALGSFYRFALRKGWIAADPMRRVPRPKEPKALPKMVREGDLARLFDNDEFWDYTSYTSVRARTILLVFYETGLRVSELASLNVGSIDLAAQNLRVVGKGSKERQIPFGTGLKAELQRYLELRARQPRALVEQAMFLSDKGARVNVSWIQTMTKQTLGLVTTQQKRSPHVLRHTFATAMLNHGASIESVRKLLGHESASTTMVYTHVSPEQLKRVYQQAHPRA